jgi:hypothetical protein
MAGLLRWAFNNPQLSDFKLVLTTEEPSQYRARFAPSSGSLANTFEYGSQRQSSEAADQTATPTDATDTAQQSEAATTFQDHIQVANDYPMAVSPPGGTSPRSNGLEHSVDVAAEAAAVSAGGAAEEAPTSEEVLAHKLVLFSGSEFFKALISRWAGSSDKRTYISADDQAGGDVAVITLQDEASFTRFKQMIRFLYAQKLDEGMEHCELVQLYLLGDEYGVASLRCACLQQLSTWPTSKWLPEADKQTFCSLATIMNNDAVASKAASEEAEAQLSGAAQVVIDQLQGAFLDLESAWQSEGMQAAFCCLPAAVVAKVIGSNSLSVTCEDTALIAAITWLRTGGQDAALAERMQVLHAVRLLYLSPWLLSWLLFYAPEGAELLSPQEKAFVLQCQSFPTAGERHQTALKAGQQGLSSPPRSYAAVTSTKQLEFGVPEQRLLDAVQECFKDEGVLKVQTAGDSKAYIRFHRGVAWQGEVRITSPADSTGFATVWVGAVPSLVLPGIRAELADDVVRGPCSYRFHYTIGSRGAAHNDPSGSASSGMVTRLVPEWGITLASIRSGDDARQALAGSFTADGRLVVTATLY